MEHEEIISTLLSMCETDPDAVLSFINDAMMKDEILQSYTSLQFCKARAFQYKGLKPLVERPGDIQINTANKEELQRYLTDQNLNCLELSLAEFKKIEDSDFDFVKGMDITWWQSNLDGLASILEQFRPGKVQKILQKTKIMYFGIDRILNLPDTSKRISPDLIRPYLDTWIEYPSIVQNALIADIGNDSKGRQYLQIWFLGKSPDDFLDTDTFGDLKIGEIFIFNDGTYSAQLSDKPDNVDFSLQIPQIIQCRQCGGEIRTGKKFCANCGAAQELLNSSNSSSDNRDPQGSNTADEWIDSSRKLLSQNLFKEGLQALNNAISIDPNNAITWGLKGMAFNYLDQYNDSILALDRSITLNPNDADIWEAKGLALKSLKKFSEALDSINMSININPKSSLAWKYKGESLLNLNRNEEAILSFNQAIALDPTDIQLWLYRGLVQENLQQYQEAIHSYDQAINLDPTAFLAWESKGIIFEHLGKHEEAIKILDNAIKIFSGSERSWKYKGFGLAYLSHFDEAIYCLEKSISIFPEDNETQEFLRRVIILKNNNGGVPK